MKRVALPAAVGLALLCLALAHPGLRFVDFIAFCDRAQGLPAGLVDPLYPVGYPAALRLLTELTHSALWSARSLSIAGAVGLAWVLQERIGPIAAAAAATTLGFLAWGSTEGTDMLAASLTLAAVLQRDWKAGPLLGAALLVRYTAIAAAPIVLFSKDWRRWIGALAVTAPHWLTALVLGEPLLPDQSANLAIGAGGEPPPLISLDTLHRAPMGFWLAFRHMEPVAWVGLAGLLVGIRDPRARKLLAFGGLHLVLLAIVFSKPRLALPATLALACGSAWLLRWRYSWVILALPLAWNGRLALTPTPQQETLGPVIDQTRDLDGPFLSSNPWFHGQDDGWLTRPVSLRALGPPPGVTPESVATYATSNGISHVVLDGGRTMATWPRLEPLLKGRTVPGLERVPIDAPGWVVYRVTSRP